MHCVVGAGAGQHAKHCRVLLRLALAARSFEDITDGFCKNSRILLTLASFATHNNGTISSTGL